MLAQLQAALLMPLRERSLGPVVLSALLLLLDPAALLLLLQRLFPELHSTSLRPLLAELRREPALLARALAFFEALPLLLLLRTFLITFLLQVLLQPKPGLLLQLRGPGHGILVASMLGLGLLPLRLQSPLALRALTLLDAALHLRLQLLSRGLSPLRLLLLGALLLLALPPLACPLLAEPLLEAELGLLLELLRFRLCLLVARLLQLILLLLPLLPLLGLLPAPCTHTFFGYSLKIGGIARSSDSTLALGSFPLAWRLPLLIAPLIVLFLVGARSRRRRSRRGALALDNARHPAMAAKELAAAVAAAEIRRACCSCSSSSSISVILSSRSLSVMTFFSLRFTGGGPALRFEGELSLSFHSCCKLLRPATASMMEPKHSMSGAGSFLFAAAGAGFPESAAALLSGSGAGATDRGLAASSPSIPLPRASSANAGDRGLAKSSAALAKAAAPCKNASGSMSPGAAGMPIGRGAAAA